jgi:DNA modification methylase
MTTDRIKIEHVDPTTLKPHPGNYQEHPEEQMEHLRESLRATGFYRNVVIARDNTILAGHGVVTAALGIGLRRVPVVRLDVKPDDPDALRVLVGDNEIAKLAKANDRALLALLKSIDAEGDGEAAFRGTGWTEATFHGLLDRIEEPGEPVEAEPRFDMAEQLQKKWHVEPGQIWACGRHRVACGDSTDPEIVKALLGKIEIGLVWTDPPYGINYTGNRPYRRPERKIMGDNLAAEDVQHITGASLKLAADYARPGAAVYLATPSGHMLPRFIAAFEGSGFDYMWQLVWVKDSLVLGRADYHFRHENILLGIKPGTEYKMRHENLLYGWKPGAAHFFTEDRTLDSVFEVPRPKQSDEHPTMKPVELVRRAIRSSSQFGDIVYDGFIGSGTTMLAAASEGRTCYGMDISPACVAVVLERYKDATQEDPTLEKSAPKKKIKKDQKKA